MIVVRLYWIHLRPWLRAAVAADPSQAPADLEWYQTWTLATDRAHSAEFGWNSPIWALGSPYA